MVHVEKANWQHSHHCNHELPTVSWRDTLVGDVEEHPARDGLVELVHCDWVVWAARGRHGGG